MNKKRFWTSLTTFTTILGACAVYLVANASAGGTGQSYISLAPGFTQNLFGATDDITDLYDFGILGGVAFASDGDVWSSECTFLGTRLHRFDKQTTYPGSTLHPETILDLRGEDPFDPSTGGPYRMLFPAGVAGCGLVNHPDGFIYSNSAAGIWRLDTETGKPVNPQTGQIIEPGGPAPAGPVTMGVAGNALGIAVDPSPTGQHHIVYVGADCHPTAGVDPTTLMGTCSLYDLDPVTGATKLFAKLSREEGAFIDGIYFDPSGAFVFAAHRERNFNTGEEHNSLAIIRRPLTLGNDIVTAPVNDAQLAQVVPMTQEPDGVAFHAQDGFVVTLNESSATDCVDSTGQHSQKTAAGACPATTTPTGGTITRFDFPNGFAAPPTPPTGTEFAAGGFRGDLLQVGGDGCIYATQGFLFDAGGLEGVRYDDGTTAAKNSIAQICGGFAPPPGVTATSSPGSIGDFVWNDSTHNGVQDPGELGIANVTVQLRKPDMTLVSTTSTGPDGSYHFPNLALGDYLVEVIDPAGYVPTPSNVPPDAEKDSNGSPASVTLSAGTPVRNDIDFGYQLPGPGISIDKTTNDVDSHVTPGGPVILVGSAVHWKYLVTNTGNVPLTNILVADNNLLPGVILSCPATTLIPGASMACTANGTAVAGSYTNTGTATAKTPSGGSVVDDDTDGYYGADPSISIDKTTNDVDSHATPGGPVILVGQAVHWKYFVKNTGNVLLTDIQVSDNKLLSGVILSCPSTSLAVNASMTCTADGIAVAGAYVNTGVVSAQPPVGPRVGNQDTDGYFGADPRIAIVKKTNGTDNDATSGPTVAVGSTVTWSYSVTNTGNVPLTGVSVTDDKAGAVCTIGTLTVGATSSCTKTGIAVAGQYTNIGTVTGTPPSGGVVTASNVDHYFGQNAGIAIVKKTNGTNNDVAPGPTVAVGSTVTWTYQVTNTGSVTLTNVNITDNKLSGIVCTIATLAAGASQTCTKTGAAVAGQYTNIGTVTATPPSGPVVSASNPDNYYGVTPPSACVLGYPQTSSNSLTKVVFNENTFLRTFAPSVASAGDTIKVWANDEHAMTLGVRRIVVKTATGTTTIDYPISAMGTNPGSTTNPLVGSTLPSSAGDQAGTDPANRPMYPALFITDVTGLTDDPLHPESDAYKAWRAHDWQFGGTPTVPNAVFGTWKGAAKTIDKTRNTVTVTPDADVVKNNWNLGSGSDTPPGGLSNEGYGTEVRWKVDDLRVDGQPLRTGRVYRLQFMAHDGDQNKSGGDVGQACMIVAR